LLLWFGLKQETRRFELINYSEFGTQVDGTLYGADCSIKAVHTNPFVKQDSQMVTSAKGILKKSRKRRAGRAGATNHNELTKSQKMDFKPDDVTHTDDNGVDTGRHSSHLTTFTSLDNDRLCQCHQTCSAERTGWEGSAVLHHGSVIQIGCCRFVFSVVEFGKQIPTNVSFSHTQLV
jgi:hypothetical protein